MFFNILFFSLESVWLAKKYFTGSSLLLEVPWKQEISRKTPEIYFITRIWQCLETFSKILIFGALGEFLAKTRLWGNLQASKMIGFGWNFAHSFLGWIPGVLFSFFKNFDFLGLGTSFEKMEKNKWTKFQANRTSWQKSEAGEKVSSLPQSKFFTT